jgi:hypothetical protein
MWTRTTRTAQVAESQGISVWGTVSSFSFGRAPYTCGDQRDALIAEYATYNVQLVPTCYDFTQGPVGLFYEFYNYNTGDYSWALVRYPLTVPTSSGYGLNMLCTSILNNTGPGGGVVHNLLSGYQNPAHNASIPGSAPNSRHMFGDALDMVNISNTQAEHDNIQLLANAAGAWVEPTTKRFACRLRCIHVDWGPHPVTATTPATRGKPGLYAP